MILLDGKKIQRERFAILKERLENCDKVFAVILVGNNPDSEIFVLMKQRFGAKLGVNVSIIRLGNSVRQSEIEELLKELNEDSQIGGIIVQLPLPTQLNKQEVLDAISIEKDVDALSSLAQEAFKASGYTAYTPATPRGVMSLLEAYDIDLYKKKVVVIGKSNLVGKPVARLIEKAGADVISCDKGTSNIPAETRNADIIVVAAGAPRLVTKEYVDLQKKHQVIIDVGITKDGNQKIHGDVDFDEVSKHVTAITPVPGGVGPMTVISIFENFADRVGV